MPPRRARALLPPLLLLLCSVYRAGARTCLSTRKFAKVGCSPRCQRAAARRHCQACICTLCDWCSIATEAGAAAAATARRAHGETMATGVDPSSPLAAAARATAAETAAAAIEANRHRQEKHGSRNAKQNKAFAQKERQQELGDSRIWTASTLTPNPGGALQNRSKSSVVLRVLGYVPGSEMALEYGGPPAEFSVHGMEPSSALIAMLQRAEAATELVDETARVSSTSSSKARAAKHRGPRTGATPTPRTAGKDRNPIGRAQWFKKRRKQRHDQHQAPADVGT